MNDRPPVQQAQPGTDAPLYTFLTNEDIRLADNMLQRSLDTLTSTEQGRWRNQKSGNSGTITLLRTDRSKAGNYCRDYQEQIRVSTRQASDAETACRSDDGNWYPI